MPINSDKVSSQQFAENGDLLKLTMQQAALLSESVLLESELLESELLESELSESIEWPSCRATLIDTGILLLEPKESVPPSERKNIVISCGVHGNETAPIEILNQITKEICSGQLKVKSRLLLIIGNPLAMIEGKRFTSENLNRLFKEHQNTGENYETIRARKLMNVLKRFYGKANNIHYDLHTAIRASVHEKFAIYPYQGDKPYSLDQLSFLQASGINTILFSHAPAGTFSYYSNNVYGADAFTIELGQVKHFGENDMRDFSGISRNLKLLIQGETMPIRKFDADEFNLFSVCHEIINTSDNFKFYIDKDIKNFTTFPTGTLLSEDGDNQYRTRNSGEAIVFPNPNVPVGQRVALVIKPTGI